MSEMISILIGAGALILFFWMVVSSARAQRDRPMQSLDPNNSEHVAFLMVVMGGTLTDAITAKIVLENFERTHGRKATPEDVAALVGMATALEG